MDFFGKTDPRQVPKHLFRHALEIDYQSAIRGDPDKQNYTVCPRHWHMDATFPCDACSCTFTWSAKEQQRWFEEWNFWIDSAPRHCPDCRKERRALLAAKQDYDQLVGKAREGGSLEEKQRVLQILGELEAGLGQLPDKMLETRRVFHIQVERFSDVDE